MMGVGTAELLLKSKDISQLSAMIVYLEMRNESKVLDKLEHKIEKDDDLIKTYKLQHNVEKIAETLKKENQEAAEALEKARRLFLNDFICVMRLANLIKEVKAADDNLDKYLGEQIRLRKNPIDLKVLAREQKVIENEEAEFLSVTRGKFLHELLQRALKVIDGMRKACEGKFDAAYMMRRKVFFDSYLLTYFRMTWEDRKIRKAETSGLSAEKHLLAADRSFMAYLADTNFLIRKVGKNKNPKERARLLEKWADEQTHEFVNDERALQKILVNGLINALLVLTNSTLLVTNIIYKIHNQEGDDIAMVRGFEIPRAVGELDVNEKKTILGHFEAELDDVNRARLQLEHAFMN